MSFLLLTPLAPKNRSFYGVLSQRFRKFTKKK